MLSIQDCPSSEGYLVTTYVNPDPSGPELVVFGIYESRRDYGSAM